jgi:hypothetical protein
VGRGVEKRNVSGLSKGKNNENKCFLIPTQKWNAIMEMDFM